MRSAGARLVPLDVLFYADGDKCLLLAWKIN